MMSILRKAARALFSAFGEVAGAVWEVNPFIAPRDLLNRWGTYRLRRHPLQILLRILGMGSVVWILYQVGHRWIQPWLATTVQGISTYPTLRVILFRTATALFSSLNIISCLSVAAIWNDMRHMARDGHLESLQVVPGRLSAPALYYAMATRYLPLALVTLLFLFLDPKASPFERFPFKEVGLIQGFQLNLDNDPKWVSASPKNKIEIEKRVVPQQEKDMLNPWTIYWPFISIGSMLVFCIVNFWMDTVIGFWIFCRFRVSIAGLFAAIMIVGVFSAFVLMSLNQVLQTRFSPVINSSPQNLERILDVYYFLFGSAVSVIVAGGLLTLTALRWRRIQTSTTVDPVLLRIHY